MKKIGILIVFFVSLFTVTYANTELKGVWVASVYNLDYPINATTNSNTLKNEAISILDNVKELGFNAVFLQVRPSADSLYNSKIFPWSKYLTGTNGLAPDNNFDPLAFWIEEGHKRGIEIHAWINPYRVTKGGETEYNSLSKNHPAKLHPEYIVKYTDGNYYFNPGLPEVRELVKQGVLEIIINYNIDGIHMDDYFYPGTSFNDNITHIKYGYNFPNIEDWRRNNVDLLIKELGEIIDKSNSNISYGISPFGIWANKNHNLLGSDTTGTESYYSHYADTRKWALNNWIDYIAPQIYWEAGNKAADYMTLVNWWSDTLKDSKTKLYIGLADYRCVDAKSSSVWYNGKEIERQMKTNLESNIIDGEIHYRYSSIMDNKSLYNLIKKKYENRDITVFVNGEKLYFDEKPIISNNRTLVPFRTIFESLGATVSWNSNIVTATKGNVTVKLEIGSNKMMVNNNIIKLEVPATIRNNRTFVPLRAVSEAFNNKVSWNGIARTIIIN